jgi:RNA polymerase sigma-70 factor (ECF subfamily)
MFRIASNLLRDRIRRARTNPQAMSLEASGSQGVTLAETLPQPSDGPEKGLSHLDLSARLAWALERLDETSRQMVLLRHFGQMSFKEIAEAFQCPLGTVLAKVHRALKSLRQVLENDDDSL